MSDESGSPVTKKRQFHWLDSLLALVVGIGIGVAIDRFALPLAPSKAESEIFEQTGPFSAVGGEGETNFPFPYATPPNVELNYTGRSVKVVEIKTTGFKWQDVGAGSHAAVGTWVAKGVKASRAP